MASSPSWQESPATWDRIVIAGKTFSGPVSVDFKLGRRRDVKQAPGVNGATVTDTGEKKCEVTIRLEMWLDEHWKFYTGVLVPLVQPKLPAPPASTSTAGTGQPENFFIRTPYGPGYSEALQQELVEPTSFQVVTPLGVLSNLAATRAAATRTRALAPVAVYHPALAGADIRQLHLDELSSPKRVRQGVYEVVLTGTRHTTKKAAAVATPKASSADSGLASINVAPELRGRSAPPSTTGSKP